MVLTEFLRNLTTANLGVLAEQARAAPFAPSSRTISPQTAADPGFQKSLASLQNILAGGELPETFRESVVTTNLLGLGQASIDISEALNKSVTQISQAIGSLVQPPQLAPLSPDKPTAPELPPEPTFAGDIKDTLSQQLDALAGALGVSAATAAIILGGIAGIIFLRK